VQKKKVTKQRGKKQNKQKGGQRKTTTKTKKSLKPQQFSPHAIHVFCSLLFCFYYFFVFIVFVLQQLTRNSTSWKDRQTDRPQVTLIGTKVINGLKMFLISGFAGFQIQFY
jgi:hypothetical protein